MTLLTLVLGTALVVGPWTLRRPAVPAAARRPGDGRAGRHAPAVPLDAALLLDLVDAAIGAGASVPRSLEAVGAAVGGADGTALATAGTALVLGASWPAAWADAPVAAGQVRDALEAAWSSGAAPGPALRSRAVRLRRERRRRARAAGGSLGVHLVLPLGLCFLPAFVLLGLAPLVLGLAGDLVGTLP
ncbi:type II secretion system F family protein [Cellulomonas sp. DKR-3]|uniref:Type II secretion system F family protein n=1 Tax=Cellulomonas fulva TaxID=2835530 RepID=A0ABS5TYI8_9CELL|nr:type II secretion system F family protein [Cellulomonas fulva]MBT0994152.1 type II secretion system F family protein [Cellulomonas fulva]